MLPLLEEIVLSKKWTPRARRGDWGTSAGEWPYLFQLCHGLLDISQSAASGRSEGGSTQIGGQKENALKNLEM